MEKKINIFLVGTGNVGKSLIELIARKNLYQIAGSRYKIRLIGIANRSKMYFSRDGIDANKWNLLQTKGITANVDLFIETMKQYRLPNTIFIDCTDGDAINRYYKVILKQFSIVTSNKSLNAGSYKNYLAIRNTIKKYNTDFRYSTNIGVGLPSIDIINSFLSGGDKVTAIEGLFSSTMNYVLDKLITTNKPFSRLLIEAREKGLTEPDPRNDLNGIDTARKILILARESGAKIELNDIRIENIVPVILRNIKSLDKFYNSIKIADSKFERIKRIAVNNKRKLVFSARFKNNKASVGIEMVDQTHPFYSASANEKVVLFYTEFFKHYPLVIKGQSGGAKATASVLISDILKTVG